MFPNITSTYQNHLYSYIHSKQTGKKKGKNKILIATVKSIIYLGSNLAKTELRP